MRRTTKRPIELLLSFYSVSLRAFPGRCQGALRESVRPERRNSVTRSYDIFFRDAQKTLYLIGREKSQRRRGL